MTRQEYLLHPSAYALRGSQCGSSKLDEKTVSMILRQHKRKQELIKKLNEKYSAKGLAKKLGVHHRTVEKILQREGWIHVLPTE